MKKNIYLLICFVTFTLSAHTLIAQATATPKDLFWIHGMNGTRFWESSKDPNITPYSQQYIGSAPRVLNTNSIGVGEYANQLQNNTLRFDTDNENNIAIAHSMGGLAVRRLDVLGHLPGNFVRPFGGIITVGSPLNGADILRNSKEFDILVYNTASKLTDPIFSGLDPNISKIVSLLKGDLLAVGVNIGLTTLSNVFFAGLIFSAPGVAKAAGAGAINVYTQNHARDLFFGGSSPQGATLRDLTASAYNSTSFATGGTFQHCQRRWRRVQIGYGSYPRYMNIWYNANCRTYTSRSIARDVNTPTFKINIAGNEHRSQILNLIRTANPLGHRLINIIVDKAAVDRFLYFVPTRAYVSGGTYNYFREGGIDVDAAKALGTLDWERRYNLVMMPYRLMNCFTSQSRRWSRRCGWFSFICGWVEDIINTIVCVFKTIFVETLVGYDVPVIGDSDGSVSRTSALAVRRAGTGRDILTKYAWSGVDVDVEGVNHLEMNGHREMTEAFDAIFSGRTPNAEDNEELREYFNLP